MDSSVILRSTALWGWGWLWMDAVLTSQVDNDHQVSTTFKCLGILSKNLSLCIKEFLQITPKVSRKIGKPYAPVFVSVDRSPNLLC